MPELPEVEIIVRGLKNKVLSRTFVDIWTDTPKLIKKPESLNLFKKEIKGKKIKNIRRRGKNILFDLSDNKILYAHQKMTGHFLIGKWVLKNGTWLPKNKGILNDRVNSYIRLMFFLSGGIMLALSDLRKFAKVELWDKKELENSKWFKSLGSEPLKKDFSFTKFKNRLEGKKSKIKQALMDQSIIVGIGNIYSDEILWEARIHPFRKVNELSEKELEKIYTNTIQILKKSITLGGDSVSDFRDIEGNKGLFDKKGNAYHKKICSRCGFPIQRKKISSRYAHFCANCQKL